MEATSERITPRIIEEEMKQSYLDYSMSVIVGRALPDVRDGLKPVHRRVLYGMLGLGLQHNKQYRKSARAVGEVLGKYHPHGDVAIYDSLVRMAQDFSLRYPLVDGQGNFGSLDGDSPAAMRYTETRLKKIAEEMLVDIDKETVDFIPNFDNTLKEPTVLPSRVPDLLVNGSAGIAVGMATNIPPHNMGEVVGAIVKYIRNPETSVDELMESIKGPDFPTGASILGSGGIRQMYRTGRGRMLVRAVTEIEEVKNKKRIIVKEIPYMVNKAQLIEHIADLVKDKRVHGISDLRDESARNKVRIVIELRSDAQPEIVLNQLYKHSRLQVTFGAILIALVDGQPKLLTLKDLVREYVKHRQIIVRKRTEYNLRQAEKRAHILEGLLVALGDLDKTIDLIKRSKSVDEAKHSLVSMLSVTDRQAVAILDMRLQRITSLEREKIKKEHDELIRAIGEYKSILGSEQKILGIIENDLLEIKKEYGDERRTQIVAAAESFEMEDLIKPEDMVLTITHAGYIKRMSMAHYRQQRRGGKGVRAMNTKDEDFVEDVFIANTHNYILFFTNKGKVHWVKVYEIPEGSRIAKGKPIVNLLHLDKEEKITAFVPVRTFTPGKFLFMVTKKGTVKKTPLELFANPRRGGIISINLEQDDELIDAKLTDGGREIILGTRLGMAVRFKEADIRATGRTSIGVIGIRLRSQEDYVVGSILALPGRHIFTLTDHGFGKRTPVEDYRLINRGGVGVINIRITDKNGKVAEIKSVKSGDELMLISRQGIAIRTPVDGVSVIGRNTQGVRVMRIEGGDTVVAAARIVSDS